jgi:RNA polymerase sigma factor (sigma-70 family)
LALEEQTETELVALAQAGDVDAFAQLIERTRVIALALAFRLIANPETVRDVVQEATLQAFLSLDRLRDTTRFRPWFSGIVLNLCRTWLREQNTPTLSLEVLATQGQAVTCSSFPRVPDPSETVAEQELYQLVQEIVQGLSSTTRSVIWLFYYEQMSMQEIATQLALSLSAVKNRLHKGRKELRRQLLVAYPEIEHRQQVTKGIRRRNIMLQVTVDPVVPHPSQSIIILREVDGQYALPVRLQGRDEAWLAIDLLDPVKEHQLHADTSRDFAQQLVLAVQESIEEVQIDALEPHLFYATVRLRQGTRLHEIKTTVGVALFAARSAQCPILVSEALMKAQGVTVPRDAATPEKLRAYLLTVGLPRHPQNLDFQGGTKGWTFRGGPSQNFDWGIDTSMVYQGKPCFFLRTKEGASVGKSVLQQAFLADEYRGKRLRLSCFLKTEHVEGGPIEGSPKAAVKGSITLWLEVEGVNETLRQANAQEHALQGTHDWVRRELSVEVPQTSISVGLALVFLGRGQVWLSDVQLEVVDEDISVSPPRAT